MSLELAMTYSESSNKLASAVTSSSLPYKTSCHCVSTIQKPATYLKDIFLFGLSDQMSMSKIIADSENLTTAEIHQRLKKLESGQATAKHITKSNGNNAGVNQLHGILR